MSVDVREVEERITGARIVDVKTRDAKHVELHFEHRGTDEDSGVVIAQLFGIYFNDGGFDS